MNVNEKDLEGLRALLANYKQNHETFTLEKAESLNCSCGSTCIGGCFTYCKANLGR